MQNENEGCIRSENGVRKKFGISRHRSQRPILNLKKHIAVRSIFIIAGTRTHAYEGWVHDYYLQVELV